MQTFQNGRFTAREHVLARLAREIGRGRNAIYHGTRHPQEVLRGGKLKPDGSGKVSLSRSPEVAAYFALLPDDGIIRWSPAVLVLCRSSLIQSYRLDPWRYGEDWHDEQEEVIWGRTVSFRRHLLGAVREADLTNALGELEAGVQRIRDGRANVRDLIAIEREQRNLTNTAAGCSPRTPALLACVQRSKVPRKNLTPFHTRTRCRVSLVRCKDETVRGDEIFVR